jgi:hypothetical protein
VNVFVTFDLAGPPNPSIPCLLALTTATLEIAGVSYVHGGYLFENAFGFGSAQCDPGSNRVEVVVPFWFEGGPQLPNGWTPFGGNPLPGLFWPGPLTMNPDKPIGSSFGYFSAPGHSPQRFTANLVPVPEPSTVALLGIGTALCVATLRRRRAG